MIKNNLLTVGSGKLCSDNPKMNNTAIIAHMDGKERARPRSRSGDPEKISVPAAISDVGGGIGTECFAILNGGEETRLTMRPQNSIETLEVTTL